MDDIKKDDRFSRIGNDPRFRRMQKKERKVKIDKRFKDMFTDKKFKLKYSVDKRGRPVDTTTNEDFRKYYDISDEDSDDNLPASEEKSEEGRNASELENDEDDEQEDDIHVDESDESGLGSGPDLARGEGNVETSSEEDDSDDEQDDDDDMVNVADLDGDAVETEEITSRLAVCNLDWDRVKAQDIYVLLQSFKPSKGIIKSVKIYPSEFGLERMKKEEISGPTELTQKPSNDMMGNDSQDLEGDTFHTEKLRKYQLNRLRYYYAVVDCDSIPTANQIYEECDGMEYESSSNRLDLRFIPEDMIFEHEPKAVCTELPVTYKPSLFFTTALCQSKVDLTWDETDHERLKVTMNPTIGKKSKKGKNEVKEEDFKAYLASSSDEDDDKKLEYGPADLGGEDSESEDEEQQISKYKNLVQSIAETEEKKKNRDVEMEITWEPGLKETAEKAVKKKGKEKDMTVWEKFLEKKKDKKQKKKEQKQKIDQDDLIETREGLLSDSDKAAFSDDEVPDDIKSDPFFQQQFSDDTRQRKKKKGKKKTSIKSMEENPAETAKNEASLSLLMMDEEHEDDKKHYSLKKLVQDEPSKKRKKKKRETDEPKCESFQIDTADPRFEALYTSHMYNIDPSAPEFKKTKGMKDIVDAKQEYRQKDLKRKLSEETASSKIVKNEQTVKDNSLQKLVESVKTKTKHFKNKR